MLKPPDDPIVIVVAVMVLSGVYVFLRVFGEQFFP